MESGMSMVMSVRISISSHNYRVLHTYPAWRDEKSVSSLSAAGVSAV